MWTTEKRKREGLRMGALAGWRYRVVGAIDLCECCRTSIESYVSSGMFSARLHLYCTADIATLETPYLAGRDMSTVKV